MGYELHITRRQNWSDIETNEISLDEWMNYINSDAELEIANGYMIKSESDINTGIPGFCEWNGHPTEKEPNARR